MNFDIHYNAWGTLLHMRSPARLGLALLDRAADWPAKALALGFLTHFSVDVVFHSEISASVSAEADGSRSLDMEHKRIEEQMDFYVFSDLLGHSGMGTPYARSMLRFSPKSAWSEIFFSAITEIHGNAPDITTLKRWKNKLALYGFLVSIKKAPWVTKIREQNQSLQKKSLTLARESIELAQLHIEIGLKYLEGSLSRDDFLSAIPDRSMMDGGPASPPKAN
jgi:hypothetical protein